MKKLIFLLLMLLVGFGLVFAAPSPAQPPGAFEETTAKKTTIPMAEYVVSFDDVTQLSALAATTTAVSQSSIMFDMVHDSTVQTNSGSISILSTSINTGQTWTTGTAANYYLRC
jgi:hypothetical protein